MLELFAKFAPGAKPLHMKSHGRLEIVGNHTDHNNGLCLVSGVNMGIDAYFANTTDQIFERTIPVMGAGMSSQYATMGKIRNWGIEASLRSMNIKTKDFSWSTNLQFTLSRSILKELYGDGNDDITNELFLNESLGAIYGYKFERVVQTDDQAPDVCRYGWQWRHHS